MNIYPNTYRAFIKWCNSNKLYGKYYITKLSDIRLNDVTLRTNTSNNFIFFDKVQLFHEISYNHNPKSIEIGPIKFRNSEMIRFNEINLYDYIINHQNLLKNLNKDIYVMIPNIETLLQLLQVEEDTNFYKNLSFFSYSKKQQEVQMNKILYFLNNLKGEYKYENNDFFKTKINVTLDSDHDLMIHQMLKYHKYNINTICFSDPKSIINEEKFEYIIRSVNYNGIPYSQLSLDLYINKNEKLIKKIVHQALDYGIKEFNVSLINQGTKNITYEIFYKFLIDYIVENVEKNE